MPFGLGLTDRHTEPFKLFAGQEPLAAVLLELVDLADGISALRHMPLRPAKAYMLPITANIRLAWNGVPCSLACSFAICVRVTLSAFDVPSSGVTILVRMCR